MKKFELIFIIFGLQSPYTSSL